MYNFVILFVGVLKMMILYCTMLHGLNSSFFATQEKDLA